MSKFLRVSIPLASVVLLIASAISWNEARKEVIYLCGNFAPGTPVDSVVRQLDTGTYLGYVRDGTRITAGIPYAPGTADCVIEFDAQQLVVQAVLQ